MRHYFVCLLAALCLSLPILHAQEVKHAPTVKQCRADQRLWLSEMEDNAASIGYEELKARFLEMRKCESLDPERHDNYLAALVLIDRIGNAPNVTGDWRGTLEAGIAQLRLDLHITKAADGTLHATLDSVDEDELGIPVESVVLKGEKLTLDVPAVHGRYEGTLDDYSNSIEGTWTKSASVSLKFTRREVEQIEIESVSVPWVHPPSTAAFLIINSNFGYWCGNKPVGAQLVKDLVSALNEAAMPEPSLQNLGLTREWLEETVRSDPVKSEWKYEAGEGKEGTDLKQAFKVAFTDPEFVKRVLPRLFGEEHTDDYPWVTVVVTYNDGSVIAASSPSQHVFMLPWRLGNSSNVKTFNANISRAVAALMENDTTNRERLQGRGFFSLAHELADAVAYAVRGITSRDQ